MRQGMGVPGLTPNAGPGGGAGGRPAVAAAAAVVAPRGGGREEDLISMLIGEIISVALGALRANKLRSLLTMLGIVIGVAAVIAVVALGTGAQEAVKDRIAALGTTLLTVNPGQQRGGGVAYRRRAGKAHDRRREGARRARDALCSPCSRR